MPPGPAAASAGGRRGREVVTDGKVGQGASADSGFRLCSEGSVCLPVCLTVRVCAERRQ